MRIPKICITILKMQMLYNFYQAFCKQGGYFKATQKLI